MRTMPFVTAAAPMRRESCVGGSRRGVQTGAAFREDEDRLLQKCEPAGRLSRRGRRSAARGSLLLATGTGLPLARSDQKSQAGLSRT